MRPGPGWSRPATAPLVAALVLSACALDRERAAPRFAQGFAHAELERREAQIARGLAGTRDRTAERDLTWLACRIAAERCDAMRIYVVDAAGAQTRAWSNGMLLVHGGLFDSLDDEAELVFALAHEIAHLELGHFGSPRTLALELAADAWAGRRLRELGYRTTAGATLLRRLAERRDRPPDGVQTRLDAMAGWAPSELH